ncbi:hypothetical protein HY494_01490 [Candidatus Woesearchaeota archaeon]|nr:hypothetical protein [Candidatus Woesearchaeota archaeon]
MKAASFVKAGLLAGVLAGLGTGITYLVNNAYNDSVKSPFNDVAQYKIVDGLFASTVITKGDPKYRKDYTKIEQSNLNETRIYIGYHGCFYVDEITIRPELFGTGTELKYDREKDALLKEELFLRVDIEMEEQCRRFMPLMYKHHHLP